MKEKKLLRATDARALYALMRECGMYPTETETETETIDILTNCNSIELYMFMGMLDMVPAIKPIMVDTDMDPVQMALCNSKDSQTLYNLMRKYGMLRVNKTDMLESCPGARVMANMGLDSVTVYKLYNGIALDNVLGKYSNSFETYKFYKYDVFGKVFKFKKFTIDTMHTIFAMIRFYGFNYVVRKTDYTTDELRNMGASDNVNSYVIYSFYKGMAQVRKPHNRAGRYHNVKDTPRGFRRGLVSVDYYISKDDELNKEHRLARDKANDSQGHQNIATVDVLPTLFKKSVKASDNARHSINVYNSRCLDIVSKIEATKKQIVYGKSGNIKIALYAIVWRQGEQARVIYFNIMSDIAYIKRYSFKDNKATKYNLVKLAQVKDRDIMVYADTITDGYKKKKSKHQKAQEQTKRDNVA